MLSITMMSADCWPTDSQNTMLSFPLTSSQEECTGALSICHLKRTVTCHQSLDELAIFSHLESVLPLVDNSNSVIVINTLQNITYVHLVKLWWCLLPAWFYWLKCVSMHGHVTKVLTAKLQSVHQYGIHHKVTMTCIINLSSAMCCIKLQRCKSAFPVKGLNMHRNNCGT